MNDIPIVMITDDNYFITTLVTIQSLYESNKNNGLLVYVVAVELTEKNIKILKNAKFNGMKIKIIEASPVVREEYQKKNQYVSKTALLKFEIANILSQHDRVLYMDSDILVLNDIMSLLSVDLNDNYAAVVADIDCVYDRKDHKRLKKTNYFNSGIMLLNCKKIRNERLNKKMIQIKESRKDFHYMDQDVINYVFGEKVIYLPLRFNYIVGYDYYPIKIINDFYGENYISDDNIHKDIIILHLAGQCKPWNNQLDKNYEIWMKFYKKSYAKDLPLKKIIKYNGMFFLKKVYLSNSITQIMLGNIELLRKEKYRDYNQYYFMGIRLKKREKRYGEVGLLFKKSKI